MNLNIRSGTVGCNNKILIHDGTFSLEKNDKVNTFELAKISHKAIQQPTCNNQKPANTQTNPSQRGEIALIISMAGVFAIWNMLQKRPVIPSLNDAKNKKCLWGKTWHPLRYTTNNESHYSFHKRHS